MELPSLRSACALLLSVVGAVAYVLSDSQFQLRAYSWAALWLLMFLFDQIYIKHIVNTVDMSTWTRTYYMNAIAFVPVCIWSVAMEGAPGNLLNGWTGSELIGVAMFSISCILGTAISFCSFAARAALSA